MNIKLLATVVFFLNLSACTSHDVYNIIQENRQGSCPEDLNTHSRDECREGLNKDYRDYQREREALLKGGQQ